MSSAAAAAPLLHVIGLPTPVLRCLVLLNALIWKPKASADALAAAPTTKGKNARRETLPHHPPHRALEMGKAGIPRTQWEERPGHCPQRGLAGMSMDWSMAKTRVSSSKPKLCGDSSREKTSGPFRRHIRQKSEPILSNNGFALVAFAPSGHTTTLRELVWRFCSRKTLRRDSRLSLMKRSSRGTYYELDAQGTLV